MLNQSLRNIGILILIVAIKAAILMFCLNLTIAPRFDFEPFRFGECFIYVGGAILVFWDSRRDIIIGQLNSIIMGVESVRVTTYGAAVTKITQLSQIVGTVKRIAGENAAADNQDDEKRSD